MALAIFLWTMPAYAESMNPAQLIYDDAYMTAWAERVIPDILTYDDLTAKTKLETARKYFTTMGYKSFYAGLEKSRMLEMVQKRKLGMAFHLTGAAKICLQGIDEGKPRWMMEAPGEYVYTMKQDGTQRKSIMTVVVSVVRSQEPQNVNGIGIKQWIAAVPQAGKFDPCMFSKTLSNR